MKRVKCILLVDDDNTSVYINSSIIEGLGIAEEVVIARNGKEALAMITKKTPADVNQKCLYPQLILLDVNMPVMNGFEFLEAFNQLHTVAGTRVALLSSSYHPRDLQKAKELSVTAFLAKPLTEQVLLNLIENLDAA